MVFSQSCTFMSIGVYDKRLSADKEYRTTTELTTSFATWVATTIGLSNIEGGVEVVVRVVRS